MADSATVIPRTLRRPNTLVFETNNDFSEMDLINLIVNDCPSAKLQGFFQNR